MTRQLWNVWRVTVATLVFMCLGGMTVNAGLIGHWKFDEGSGTTAADSSTNANTATDAAPSWIAGVSGSAVDDPRFKLADSSDLYLDGSVPFTISLWARTDLSAGGGAFVGFEGYGSGGDIYAFKMSSGKPQLTPSGTTTPDTLYNYSSAGANWVHIVGVHEPGVNSRIYVDGAQVASGGAGSIPTRTTIEFTMGIYWTDNYGYTGEMDDVQVYDVALSAADVLELYENPGYALGDAPEVPPVVVSVDPADNATVPTPASLTITFDDDITNDVAGSITLTNLSTGATDVMDASELAFVDDVLTITPDPVLANGTPYAVLIDTNAIKSVDNGLHFAGYTTATNWNFTTTNPDSTKPGLVPPFYPADGATGVSVGASLVAVFDEPIAKGTGNIVITNLTDGVATIIAVTDAQVTIDSTTNLIINPTANLLKSKSYAVLIAADAIKDDPAGNFFVGITDTNTWNFATRDRGLIGHWTFDEGSGTTAADSSINSNTATTASGSWIAGKAGQAFDDPRFTLADSSELYTEVGAAPFTISLWAKADAASGGCLAGFEGTGSNGDIYSLKVVSDKITLPPASTATPDTLMTYSDSGANWVHIVGVNEPGVNSRIYIDGVEKVTGSVASIPAKTSIEFTMGKYWNSGSYTYNGALDDVQVYDKALSAADVLELYENPGYALGDAPEVAPVVVSVDPADNATVATPASLTITFDTDVTNDVAGSITLTNLSTGATDVMGASELAFSGAALTITPDPVLANGTPYAVLIDTNAIKSVDNGLHFAGYTTATNWNFTTTNPDSTKPTVVPPYTPADGTTNVAPSVSLVVMFGEPIAKGTGNIVLTNLTDSFATTIAVTDGQVTIVSDTNLTINPTGGLTKGKDYAVLIDTNAVKDLADNFFDGISDTNTWNFTTVAPGLIGHWKFDEGSGTTAADASLFGNTATDAAPVWIAGASGSAVDDPRFSLADSSDLVLSGSVPFTISFWIKPPDSTQGNTCYAGFEGTGAQNNDSYAIKCNGTDQPQLTPSGTTAPDTIWNYSDSGANWVHVVGVHEPGVNSRMYIDGSQVATGGAGSIPNPANHDFVMGSYPGGSYGLDGMLDDVQVYDIALSAADVLELYENPGYALGDAPEVPPVVVSVDPADNATVATPASLTITFDTDVTNDVAGSITLTNLSSGATDVMGASELAFVDDVLTITPDPVLANGTPYAVLIDTNAIKSVDNGLHFAGYTTATNWNFTTTNPDSTKPTVVPPYTPADGTTNVAPSVSLVVMFGEPIAKGTGNIVLTNLTDSFATTIAVTDGQVTIVSDTNLTINPTGGLTKGKDYAVLIDTNAVKDLADNFFDGISDTNTWNFTTVAPGLIGHWKFDEGSGTTAADASAYGNTATDAAPVWIAGVSGSAVDDPQFKLADSSDLYLDGAVPFTIALWAKTDVSAGSGALTGFEGYGSGGDIYAFKMSSGKPQLTPSGTTTPDTLYNYSSAGADWVHVVGVHEPGVNSRIYVDGVQVASGGAGSIPTRSTIEFTMGIYWTDNYGYNGALDDVQVYDIALSADNVAELYNNPGHAWPVPIRASLFLFR